MTLPRFLCSQQRSLFLYLAVGQKQWYHFGVGAPPILVYFSGDWDVHWGVRFGFSPMAISHIEELVLSPVGFVFGCGRTGRDQPCRLERSSESLDSREKDDNSRGTFQFLKVPSKTDQVKRLTFWDLYCKNSRGTFQFHSFQASFFPKKTPKTLGKQLRFAQRMMVSYGWNQPLEQWKTSTGDAVDAELWGTV